MKTYYGYWLRPIFTLAGSPPDQPHGPFPVVRVDRNGRVVPMIPRKPSGRLSGFSWANRGLGARELAYCILMDLYDNDTAGERSEQFRDEIVAHLEPTWTLTEDEIHDWLAKVKGTVRA